MIERLIKFNAWYAFACGIFCLLVATMIVDQAMIALGVNANRIIHSELYLLAVSFVRVIGVLLFAYAFSMRLLTKQKSPLKDIKWFFAIITIGVILWGGMFLFLIFTKSLLLALVSGIGLLEWLIIPVLYLFEYNKQDEWKSVKPK